MRCSASSRHSSTAAAVCPPLGGAPSTPLPRWLPWARGLRPGTCNSPRAPPRCAAAHREHTPYTADAAAAVVRPQHRHHHRHRHGPLSAAAAPASSPAAASPPLPPSCPPPRLLARSSSSSRNEAELPQPLGHGVTSCRAAPPNPTPSPTAAAAKGGDGEAAVAAEAVAAPATADVVLGPRAAAAAAAAATAGASPAVAAWPAPLLSRRRVGRLAAAALLLALSPVPLPIPVPSTGRGLLPLLSFPLSFPAPAAAAAATAAAAEEGEGEEVFGYVAPEPLGGPGAGSGAAAGTSSSSFPSSAAPAPRYFRTLAAAVAECPPGGVVLVAAGRYRERLLLSSERPLTLRAWPKGARVEVVWETQEPYQSTLDISAPANAPANTKTKTGGKVVVEGLTIRHSSKSVANNYGVFIRGGSPLLLDCDISSASGAGVGIEGASPQLVGCRVHDCARQGVAIFGAAALDLDLDLAVDPGMMYGMTGGVVRDCDVYGNALDGVLVRSGASPDLVNNLIHNNGGVGVNLQDCSGRYEGNTVYDNARGSVAVSALFECDPGDLAGSNSLRGLMRRL
ncbi:hypothetical protein PLESTB_001739200 [Pleodorina starrii]|uniref:Right handed beta helix domain-containing protein n=1 Tax=Pleodorina starrii TaxID=330485 RepID=A0A9W6C193_9CHLO|nr:hypothetical protein PLESTB_001739200 [Pleodorina starrii]